MRKSGLRWKLSSFAVLAVLNCAPRAWAQTWGIPHLIPATQQAAMAYDSVHQVTVLFGGENDGPLTETNTTWLWNGTAWTQVFPANSPPARYGHAMAFDSVRGQVVLFGGQSVSSDTALSDTWTWDGANWTEQAPHQIPPGRSNFAMAFDAALGVTVMFGGYGFTDTWSWNGTDWTEASPATKPPTRDAPSMVYDGARGQVVMFGGDSYTTSGGYSTQVSLADTWVWNGTTWTQKLPATSPSGRTAAAMAYDSVDQATVLFGGYDVVSGNTYAQTWIWDGTTWTQKSPAASPSARTGHSMAYDAARQQTVLFGGAILSDTWTWNETNWTEAAPPTSAPPRSCHGMAYDGARQQVVIFGGAPNGAFDQLLTFLPYSDTWVWNGSIWTQKSPLTSPTARSCFSLAYDAAQQQTVLFGGLDASGNVLSDTWAWDGTNWTELAESGPPARAFYSMAYDSLHQQIVLFGGEDANGNELSDTWIWNGSDWTQESPATSPEARSRAGMSYDSVHQFVLLFGGKASGLAVLDDTWTWNGTNWTRLFPPSGNPDARAELVMTFDSAHDYSVMQGGVIYIPPGGPSNNTWLFNGTAWQAGADLYVGSFAGLAFDAAHGKTVLFGGDQSGSNITEVFPANSLTASGGTPQSTTPGQAFATPLQVTATNLLGNPIASDTVTFSVDPTFATLSSATATTGSNGQAQITATSTTKVGSYSVTAVIADGGSATFALTNTGAGPAASIAETGGTGQSTAVGTAFASALTAVVKDAAGVALSGVTVTFAAPATGASASFSPSASATTNAQGVASVNVTAGTTAGGYDVTASVSGVSTLATYTLENVPGGAASIAATGGGSQTAAISMLFSTPLTAVVKDSHGNPIPGVTVTFSAPSSGASATFTPSAAVTTNAQGIATVMATANATLGGYNVSAAVSGVGTGATFALTNASAGPATITATGGSSQSTPIGAAFATPLTAVVKNGGGNVISGVSVTFAGPGSGAGATFSPAATVTTDSTGTATVIATANGAAGGPYNVTASVSGVGTAATFALTNTIPTYTLAVTSLLEPPQPGSDSTTLQVKGTPNSWTAASNSSWLHLASASVSGSNSSLLIFNFDANTGATRSGTVTVNGNLVLTVTQAGASYVKAGVVTLVGLAGAPRSVAVDHNGNVYVADGNIKEWSASTQTVSTLIAAGTSGLGSASAVAVDSSENLYIVDGLTVKKWTAATQQLSTLISSGLTSPASLAVDGNGNLYIGDAAVVDKWTASTQQLSTLISSGLTNAAGVAVDPTGNVYVADPGNPGIANPQVLKWSVSTQQVTVLENSSVIAASGVASDSVGNIYISDSNGLIEKWTASTQTLSLLVGNGLNHPAAVAVDSSGNLYIADGVLVRKWLASTQTLSTLIDDTFLGGEYVFQGVVTDSAGDVYLADNGNHAIEKFNTSTRQLSTLVAGIKAPAGLALDSSGDLYFGNGSVQEWTASTQQLSTVLTAAQVNDPDNAITGVAVDPAGDIYVSDDTEDTVDEYNPVTKQVTTLLSQPTVQVPQGVSLDLLGNYYVADSINQVVIEGNAATQQASNLVPSGLNSPLDAQADRSGNVYIADSFTVNLSTGVQYPGRLLKYSGATKETTVLASSGYVFSGPYGVGPDASGNLFINDGTRLLELVNGFVGPQNVFELPAAGTDSLLPVIPATAPLYTTASDQSWLTITGTASGVVSFSFTANTTGAARVAHITVLGVTIAVTQVAAATTPVSIAATGGSGQSANVGTAFATALTATVTGVAGSDLSGISVTFAAPAAGAGATFSSATVQTNSSGIATATATANSTIGSYNVTATAAGVAIPATFTLTNTVAATAYSLAASSLAEPPATGTDSILIVASGSPAAWTAAAQASWLHISSGSASGTGPATVKFTFDANTGATRSGTIAFTPGSLTLTVTQAGSTYLPAGLIPLITSGLVNPNNTDNEGESGGLTVDAQDNLYITATDRGNLRVIYQISQGSQVLNPLISEPLIPTGVAVDFLGDLFFVDSGLKKWTAATQQISVLVSSGLSAPTDVALDTAGNAYIADTGDNAIKKWTASTQVLSTLVSSGLNYPTRLAVDGTGNVYFSDSGNNEIKKWTAATQMTSILVSGLNSPAGVAVDRGGNVYFVDADNNLVKEWVASTQQVIVLVPTSEVANLYNLDGVALDIAGNLFIDDGTGIYELPRAWVGPATLSEPKTAGSDSLLPVVPAGAFLGTPVSDQTWLTITGTAGGVVSFSFTLNPDAAIRVAHVTVLGATITVTQAAGQGIPASVTFAGGNAQSAAVTSAFGSPLMAVVEDAGGNPLSGIPVTFASPASGAGASFSPSATVATNAQGVVSVAAAANGTLGSYVVTASVSGVSTPAAFSLTNIATSSYAAAMPTMVEPSASGMDSVVIRPNGTPGPWIASSDATWLHLEPGSISGSGAATVVFGFDPNPGATRSGAITFNPGAVTVSVIQVGSTYVPAKMITPIIGSPRGVVTDAAGNIYYAAYLGVYKFNPFTNKTTTVITTTQFAEGVAIDSAGNVYGVDQSANTVAKWTASTQTVSTIVSSGLNVPGGLSVDGAGNLYIIDTGSSSIKVWSPATQQLSTLASGLTFISDGSGKPAVDFLGNVYFVDYTNGLLKEWVAATGQITTLLSNLNHPTAVTVDGSGNIYVANFSVIAKLSALTQQLTTVSSGLADVLDLTTDAFGSLLFADNNGDFDIGEFPRAYVGPKSISEPATAGTDSLLPVLPQTFPIYTASSDQNWLTITGTTNDVVSFAFTANSTGTAGVGHITVLGVSVTVDQLGATEVPASVTAEGGNGQTAAAGTAFQTPLTALVADSAGNPMTGISVTFAGPTSGANVTFSPSATAVTNDQGIATVTAVANATAGGPYSVTAKVTGVTTAATYMLTNTSTSSYSVGTTSLLEPNTTGVDSVLIQASGSPGAWTATSNASWLHMDNGSLTGTGTAHAVFYFDANIGATRTGTLTLNPGSFTVTVTQAGANYIPGGFITLDASQTTAVAIALDSSDNVYLNNGKAVKRSASTGLYTTLGSTVSSNGGIAVDQSGNVYYSDQVANIVFKWSSTSQTVSQLITSGLNAPVALAVDTVGNLYIADKGGIKMWNGSLTSITTRTAQGISVDRLGNIYLAQTGNNDILQWNISSQQVVTIVSSGVSAPTGVVPDAAGNLYISCNSSIQLWSAATQQLTTLAAQGNVFAGAAIDGSGNLFAIGYQDGLEELVHGFIGPANISEPATAGSDSLLVAVPSTAPLGTPSSDQTWLTISGATGGVVGFNFAANSGAAPQVGHITAMGATVTVTQAGTASNPASITSSSGSGQGAAVSTAFPTTLTAIVKDGNGNPLTGASVTFASPASGAGVTFSPAATVTTNNQGVATATATANGTAGGPYSVTATVAGVSTPATFTLTNFGAPASVTVVTGSGQRTLAGTAFAIPLEAVVKDSGGNTLSGVTVTFAGPGSNASATFSPTASVQTDSAGVAIVTAAANATQGSYSVTASVGSLNATFSLTNDAPSSLTASGGTPQSAPLNGPFTAALQVTVKDSGGNLLNGVTVSFSAPTTGASATLSGASAISNASGVASVTATANSTAGEYNVTASVSGVAGPVTFALTNSSFSPCDPTQDGTVNVADVQRMIDEALGVAAAANDLNGDGKVNIIDVQIVINAVLNLGCS